MSPRERLELLRAEMDRVFAPDTAAPGTPAGGAPCAGHCAIVSIIVHHLCGGEFVSATVGGVSHWFNRIQQGAVDVDLTGDQFDGLAHVRGALAGRLYPGTRVRKFSDLNAETLARAAVFAERLGISL